MIPSTKFVTDDDRLRTYEKHDLWVVFSSPADYPGKHVARRFERSLGRWHWNNYHDLVPTPEKHVAVELGEVRKAINSGRGCFPPPAGADECVVEVWI